uniref:Uncharacterized protein n=1 Tax=Cyclopterus lumpus TaxID=8103 RepID=A0A8C2X798_CYCLU
MCTKSVRSYPPLSVGVRPNSVQRPTDMSRELRTVTTAARARPHLDFTMSILPAGRKEEEEEDTTVRIINYRSLQHKRTHTRKSFLNTFCGSPRKNRDKHSF